MRLPLGEMLRVDALRTDAYVESLIAGVEGRPRVAPLAWPAATAPTPGAAVASASGVTGPATQALASPGRLGDHPGVPDPDVAAVARLLHATAWRPHPSFRFEERVATRLVAAARGEPVAPGAGAGAVVAFPRGGAPDAPTGRPAVPIAGIASAAVASAALSLGAAAIVAWRRGRLRRGIA